MINAQDNQRIHIGFTEATPEEVDYDSRRILQLDVLFQGLIQQNKLQCAGYLLARHGKIFAQKSMGQLNGFTKQGDFKPNSIRRIASITKAFTAVTILRLVEDGKLYLNQPVYTIIAEMDNPMHKGITIFHLLTHTSGIAPDPGSFIEPFPSGWFDGPYSPSWIKNILAGPVHCKPGEEWMYSSSAYAILGEIVSRISGVSYDEYVRQIIIEPLGLKRTFFDVPNHLYDEVCVMNEWESQRLTSTEPRINLPPRAGGGLYSTMEDLCSFGHMLLNNGELNGQRILGRKTVEAMVKKQLFGIPSFQWGNHNKSVSFGLGLGQSSGSREITSPETFSHEGAGRCALYIDPVEKLIAVYITPTSLDWVPESVINVRNVIWSGIQ
jgi:CubicO group peptidase (beta-lactamase class C family)